MKDLYTFDATIEQARITYNSVREAYRRIFDKLRVPFYEVCEARTSSSPNVLMVKPSRLLQILEI